MIQLHCLDGELFREFCDVLRDPVLKGEGVDILLASENDDEVFHWLDWAMQNADWQEHLSSLILDQSEGRLHIFYNRFEGAHGQIEHEDVLIVG